MGRSKQTLIYAGGLLVQLALTFATGIIAARTLGPAALGITTILRNALQTVAVLSPLGLDIALQKYVAQNEANLSKVLVQTDRLRLIVTALNLVVFLACAAGGGAWLEANIYRFPDFGAYLALTLIGLPFTADMLVLGAVYRARRNPLPSFFATLYAVPAIKLGLMLLLFQLGLRIQAVIYANLAGIIIPSLGLLIHQHLSRPRQRAHFPLDRNAIRELMAVLGTSSWMAASVFSYAAMRLVDILVLGIWVPAKIVGAYGILSMFAQLVDIFPGALSQTLGPEIARLHHAGDIPGIHREVNRYIHSAVILASFFFAGVVTFGSSLNVIFGPKFQFEPLVVLILPFGYLISATLGPIGYALSMTGSHKQELGILVFGTILLWVLCLALIPHFGQVGAACAVMFVFSFVNIARFLFVTHTLRFLPGEVSDLYPPVIAIVCGLSIRTVMSKLLDPSLSSLALQCVAYAALYGALTWVLILHDSERSHLRAIGRKLSSKV